jgi:hypothetical protein
MAEAAQGHSAFALRLLYTNILVHCAPKDPNALFEEFWQQMAGPWRFGRTDDEARERLKRFLARKLTANNFYLEGTIFDSVDLSVDDSADIAPDEGAATPEPPATQASIDGKFSYVCSPRR